MGTELTIDRKKKLTDNVALFFTTVLGVGGAAAGAFIPGSALLVAGIQAAAYCPAVFAIVLKEMLVSEELSATIEKQIKDCSSETAKQYLQVLKKTNTTLYELFNSMWSSDKIFDSYSTLDSIKTGIADFVSKQARVEGYEITHKDINDALDGYTQCFYINLKDHPELNQLMIYGELKNIDNIIKDVEVINKRVCYIEKTISNSEQKKKEEFEKRKQTLLSYADAQVNDIKNKVIFPWFYESKPLRDVFPDLYVIPKLLNKQTKEFVSDLSSYVDKNLMILGDAGSGKSTLLNYWFAFEKKDVLDGTICLYFSADRTIKEGSDFNDIFDFALIDREQHYLFIIDGVDETFLPNSQDYQDVILKLKTATNCNYWLGCRQDFYIKQNVSNTKISYYDLAIQEWGPDQVNHFIEEYSKVTENPDLWKRIENIKGKSRNPDGIEAMKKNPFQLSVLVFLAEQMDDFEINCTFDLYDQFIGLWVKKEIDRKTSPSNKDIIYDTLYDAAESTYYNHEYILEDIAEENTAVNGLLKITKITRGNGNRVADSLYHRSLAAFLIAKRTYQAIYENNTQRFIEATKARSRDDISNFWVEKYASIEDAETYRLIDNLIRIYNDLSRIDDCDGAKQQIIYHITRLKIEATDFIIDVINENPRDLHMRLSLAYGCVLSKNKTIRKYALDYARSIAKDPNGDDAVTNRGWTVVYFNDVDIDKKRIDVLKYKDTDKGSWENSRKARIKRFTRKDPRYKDLRFWILDIPLFHSYLIDRNWNDLSDKEYRTLEGLKFSKDIFDDDEIEFMTSERDKMLVTYKCRLEQIQ